MRAYCFSQQPPTSSCGVPKTRRVLARAEATRLEHPDHRIVATHVSLDSLSVHKLQPGHYVAPLLCSGDTSLPFAIGLELFSSTCHDDTEEAGDVLLPELPESEGLLSLQYILDGRAQIYGRDKPLSAQAGDTLLSRCSSRSLALNSLSSTASVAPALDQQSFHVSARSQHLLSEQGNDDVAPARHFSSSMQSAPSCMDAGLQWDAAILTVMVEGEAASTGSGALQDVMAAWQQAPVAGTLSQKVVSGIIERAQTAATAALADSRSAEGSAAELQAGPLAQLSSALRSRGLAVWPGQHDEGPADTQSALALPAAVQNLPSDALQYLVSGILGRWFRQHSQPVDSSMQPNSSGQHPAPASTAIKRSLHEVAAFRLPNQTNRLALIMDPLTDRVPFTFGIEIFERGHRTTPHTHPTSQELFFILAGQGEGFCGDHRFPVRAGDIVVFPPRSVHGIDVSEDARMYCLELMQPNDMFAEFVKMGQPLGGLADDDLCILAALGCGGAA